MLFLYRDIVVVVFGTQEEVCVCLCVCVVCSPCREVMGDVCEYV